MAQIQGRRVDMDKGTGGAIKPPKMTAATEVKVNPIIKPGYHANTPNMVPPHITAKEKLVKAPVSGTKSGGY